MAARITKGTKEFVEVTVVDNTGLVTTLAGSTPTFDGYEGVDDTGVSRIAAASATVSTMVLHCLVDTSSGTWNKVRHALYVKFTVGSEQPRLGPFDLYIH